MSRMRSYPACASPKITLICSQICAGGPFGCSRSSYNAMDSCRTRMSCATNVLLDSLNIVRASVRLCDRELTSVTRTVPSTPTSAPASAYAPADIQAYLHVGRALEQVSARQVNRLRLATWIIAVAHRIAFLASPNPPAATRATLWGSPPDARAPPPASGPPGHCDRHLIMGLRCVVGLRSR